jgi:hypothetical protein
MRLSDLEFCERADEFFLVKTGARVGMAKVNSRPRKGAEGKLIGTFFCRDAESRLIFPAMFLDLPTPGCESVLIEAPIDAPNPSCPRCGNRHMYLKQVRDAYSRELVSA